MESNALMRSLGRPNREQVVTTRPAELSTLQALDLSNGPILTNLLEQGAKNLQKQHLKWNAEQMTTWLYATALSREPGKEELRLAKEILGESITTSGLSDLLWGVLMLPEFQYNR